MTRRSLIFDAFVRFCFRRIAPSAPARVLFLQPCLQHGSKHQSIIVSVSREHSTTMSKVFLLSIALLLVSTSRGWVQQSAQNVAFQRHHTRRAMMADDKKKGGDDAPTTGVETDDPCWQNMLDDDCSMGNIYASNFVAAEWIKSMPCGQGIEVSLFNFLS